MGLSSIFVGRKCICQFKPVFIHYSKFVSLVMAKVARIAKYELTEALEEHKRKEKP